MTVDKKKFSPQKKLNVTREDIVLRPAVLGRVAHDKDTKALTMGGTGMQREGWGGRKGA